MNLADSCLRHSQRFETKAAAQATLAAWRETGRVKGLVEPFKCKMGGHWHIGRPGRGRRRRR